MDKTGLVHIYTGDGKGKTTAALGLGIRACGSGMKVLLVQFLKSMDTSELEIIKKLQPDFTVIRGFNCKKFAWNMTPPELQSAAEEAAEIFEQVKNIVNEGKYDLIILDELLGVVSLNFLEINAVLDLIRNKPQTAELILTGRNAPELLIESADYVSEIKAVKHPYDKGIAARRGIEF
ncbi:MAG: ATP:corrinoid adenosyltransferase [Eubacterium sp.]|nr:ATP:corrinoid adenosyltransferase [Eubacterium sp.]